MQNFIGPLPSSNSLEHAENHASNGTDPLTPEAIGAASEFYAENLAQDAINAAMTNTQNAIASHLSTQNPHSITPTLIGAAAATHTHYYTDIADRTARWMYVNPTFGSGWSAFSTTNYKWSFRELAGTLVEVSGLVQRTATSNRNIFSFNSMYAPPSIKRFSVPAWINNAVIPCLVDVMPNGEIIFVYPVYTDEIIWISLDGLIWFNNQ